MKIKNLFVLMVLAGLIVTAAGVLKAQSLAELARKERAKRASQPKATKVFTNEDMPKSTSLEPSGSSAAGETASDATAKPAEGGEAGAASSEKPADETKTDDKKQTKEYWQAKFQAAKADLDRAQEVSTLADDELSLAQADAARQLNSNEQQQAAKNVAGKQSAADDKRAALDKAKQAMDDLKKEFEESGAPADWLPEEAKNQ